MIGHATQQGTSRYAARFDRARDAGHFRHVQGCWWSSIGMGTYLGRDDDQTDERYVEAAKTCLRGGVNVLDTAVSYRWQRSERSLGRALQELASTGQIARDEVLVCTKGGYLPFDGAPPRDPKRYVLERFVQTGIVDGPDDLVEGIHCMTGRYLRSQIEASLSNLGLESLDVYYVHNPETQLPVVGARAFYARLEEAFAALEDEASRGRIVWYGTATWSGYRCEPTAPEHVELEQVVAAARRAGGDGHRFRFVQLPISLGNREAFAAATQSVGGERMTLLAAAERLGVHVVASASLMQGRLSRGLPPVVADKLPGLHDDAQRAIQYVRAMPVASALVGMSQAAHVKTNLALLPLRPPALGAERAR